MKKNKYIIIITAAVLLFTACKKELQVGNPNQPTVEDAKNETGIISLAKAAVYINGFNGVDLGGLNTLGSSFFSNAFQYQELLGDVVSATASNQNINVVNLPDYAILDDGSKLSGTSTQRGLLRISNARSARTSNPFYYEWGYMYSMNNACNNLLQLLPSIKFSGDSTTRKNTIRAWAYFWKGYAYSRIGSLYYAGLINDAVFLTNNKFVDHNAIIAEATKNLDLATAALGGATSAGDYSTIISSVIPEFLAVGHGGYLTINEFKHTINTLKARNILVNKKVSDMTAADWNAIIALTSAGVQKGESVFTARSAAANGFMSASAGSVAAQTVGASGTFSISERFIQEYKTGDQRLANNFSLATKLNSTGGFTYSTRYRLIGGGKGMPGVVSIADKTTGAFEQYVSSTYEENTLMMAEALINTGQVDAGLALVDAERNYQGAGLPAVSGTGLSVAQAEEEVRRERRVALVFRGISFYDYRRFGFIYDISKGGGRTNAVVLTPTGQLNTHATINYNFLDYWDVPADETDLNPPGAGSAPTINPN